jgi:hypothetical protein
MNIDFLIGPTFSLEAILIEKKLSKPDILKFQK